MPVGAPKTWNASELVTNATMNVEIRDQFNAILDDWPSFTTTWNGSTTNPTLGNGTLAGRYKKVGKNVDFRIYLQFGSTTTVGSGLYYFNAPVTPSAELTSVWPIGNFYAYDASAADRRIGQVLAFGSNLYLYQHGSPATLVDHDSPLLWATGDAIVIQGQYRAA